MSSVRKGLILSSVERYGVLAMGLATTLVTARLLTPADFGVAIIGLAIFGLLDIFREFGGGTYIVQVDETTPERVQTVFTTTLILALPLFFILFVFAQNIADFYHAPGLKAYLEVSSWCLLLSSFSSPVYALLSRDLKFGRLTILSLTTNFLSSIITMLMAVLGFSYMSYAWAQLASTIVYFALCIAWGPAFPVYRVCFAEWRRVMAYGIYDSARGLLNHMGDSAPFLAFGKTLGAQGLGIYHRALTVSRLPERTVLAGFGPVLLPAFSKHAREGQDLARSFLRGVEHVTVLLWPALIGVTILATPLVTIMLGSQWTATVPLVQIIASSYLAWFALNLPRPALVAVGAIRDTMTLALLTVPVLVGVQIAASFYSVEAVAWTFVPGNIYAVLVSVIFVRRRIPFAWSELARAMRKSAIVALLSALPPIAMALAVGGMGRITVMEGVAAAVLSGITWFIAINLVNHPIRDEIVQLFNAASKSVFGDRQADGASAVPVTLTPGVRHAREQKTLKQQA
jgi:O-antigen/teichoic acid export membrane protein